LIAENRAPMSDARLFWKKHVVGWRASGETAKRYSAKHGLAANSLCWWASRLKRDGELGEAAMRWAKLEVASAATLEVAAPARLGRIVLLVRDVQIAVERGFDTETLAAIVAVIERRPL
jgi:hypothetical protein